MIAYETLARKAGANNFHDPAKNCIGAELRAAFLKMRLPKIDAARFKAVSASLDQAAIDQPDFRTLAGQTELRIFDALARGQLASAAPALITALQDLKARVPTTWLWDSVYAEAQFTLLPYLAMARGAEKNAAQGLLEELRTNTLAS